MTLSKGNVFLLIAVLAVILAAVFLTLFASSSKDNGIGETNQNAMKPDIYIHGVKTLDEFYSFGWNKLLTFKPFENSTIDSSDFTLATDDDDQVHAFRAIDIPLMEYLPVRVGEKFPNITLYEVTSCAVKCVKRENFKDLGKIKELILQENQIASIEKHSFDELIQLKVLNLKGNEIKTLDEDLFKLNVKLRSINFKDNQLVSLPVMLLTTLVDLEEIGMNWNNIRTFDGNLFSHNVNLQEILLEYNQIEVIKNGDTFKKLKLLKLADLKGNKCINKEYGMLSRMELIGDIRRLCAVSS